LPQKPTAMASSTVLSLLIALAVAAAAKPHIITGKPHGSHDSFPPLDPDQPVYSLEIADRLPPDLATAAESAADTAAEGSGDEVESQSAETREEVVTTTGQRLECWVPAVGGADGDKDGMVAAFEELEKQLDVLIGECFKWMRSGGEWWGYEFCYKVEVAQSHVPGPNSPEQRIDFSMGKFTGSRLPDPASEEVYGQEYVQFYTGGQKCDETGKPRESTVVFKCDGIRPLPGAQMANFVVNVQEVTLCKYELVFYSKQFCESDEYRQRHERKLKPIRCNPMRGEGPYLDITVPTFTSVWNWF